MRLVFLITFPVQAWCLRSSACRRLQLPQRASACSRLVAASTACWRMRALQGDAHVEADGHRFRFPTHT